MALTRPAVKEILSKAGVAAENMDEAVKEIIAGHTATVDALKEKIENADSNIAAVEKLTLRLHGISVIQTAHMADTAVALAHRTRAVRTNAPRFIEAALRDTNVRELYVLEQQRIVRRRHKSAALRRVPNEGSLRRERNHRRHHCGDNVPYACIHRMTMLINYLCHIFVPFPFTLNASHYSKYPSQKQGLFAWLAKLCSLRWRDAIVSHTRLLSEKPRPTLTTA